MLNEIPTVATKNTAKGYIPKVMIEQLKYLAPKRSPKHKGK